MKLRVGSVSATVHKRRGERCEDSSDEGLRGLGLSEEEGDVVVEERDVDCAGESWDPRGGGWSAFG